VGYVPQSGVEHVPYTVEEFVLMARYAYLNPFSHFTETDRSVALRAMEQTEVLPFAQRRMHTLSGGERQKVFIAAALTQEPRVMLLDEPTTFLDYRHQVEVLALVGKLRQDTGVTVITVTHDLNQGVMDFDAVLALKDGETMYHCKPDELLQENRLERLYGTSFRLLHDAQSGVKYVFPERVKQ
jgi:iron complex transport system ATP-binding protein